MRSSILLILDEKCFYTNESSDDDNRGNDIDYPIAQWVSVHAYICGLCSPLLFLCLILYICIKSFSTMEGKAAILNYTLKGIYRTPKKLRIELDPYFN